MGLNHPSDLDAFKRDEASRQSFPRLRRLRHAISRPGQAALALYRGSADADICVAVDSPSFSCRTAVLDPTGHLPPERVALVSSFPLDVGPVSSTFETVGSLDELGRLLPKVATVVSAGHHAPAGALVHALADARGGVGIVVQHGMLLPQSAPLPKGVHAVTWSAADSTYWRSGRSDVTFHELGSQLLFRASQHRIGPLDAGVAPVYVGALHGTELPRREIERVARTFCLSTGAHYRPHPSEVDLQSRLTRLAWKQLGIVIDETTGPLLDLRVPVVGMWSTGLLEAATAGFPAWFFHPDPPDWLLEVWNRYGLAHWGQVPVFPEPLEGTPPAESIAELVLDFADGPMGRA